MKVTQIMTVFQINFSVVCNLISVFTHINELVNEICRKTLYASAPVVIPLQYFPTETKYLFFIIFNYYKEIQSKICKYM